MKDAATIDFQTLPHILVVDDDDRIRTLVSKYLNDNGFLSFTAGNAQEAKEILEIGLFDALVVDVMMPGQNGRDFTKEIRKKGDVPVLLLTAQGEVEARAVGERLRGIPFTRVLSSPMLRARRMCELAGLAPPPGAQPGAPPAERVAEAAK